MTLAALDFYTFVLAVHIAAVMIAFGATFSYPLLFTVAHKADPRSVPTFLRAAQTMDRVLVMPGMIVILVAGIYLASDRWEFSQGWIGAAIAIILVLFGLQGAVLSPTLRKAVALADRDVEAAGAGDVTFSAEYDAAAKRYNALGALAGVLVLTAILVMVWKPGV